MEDTTGDLIRPFSEIVLYKMVNPRIVSMNNLSSAVSVRLMRASHVLVVLTALSGASFGSKERPHLPCEYSEIVSRKYPNTAFSMSSDAMKQRAVRKVDISGAAKQRDIRGSVGLEVLVAADGSVICAKGVYGHPMLLKDVEEAVRQWRFKPVKENNAPVAYVGRLSFALCNIACGEEGISMTLLK